MSWRTTGTKLAVGSVRHVAPAGLRHGLQVGVCGAAWQRRLSEQRVRPAAGAVECHCSSLEQTHRALVPGRTTPRTQVSALRFSRPDFFFAKTDGWDVVAHLFLFGYMCNVDPLSSRLGAECQNVKTGRLADSHFVGIFTSSSCHPSCRRPSCPSCRPSAPECVNPCVHACVHVRTCAGAQTSRNIGHCWSGSFSRFSICQGT